MRFGSPQWKFRYTGYNRCRTQDEVAAGSRRRLTMNPRVKPQASLWALLFFVLLTERGLAQSITGSIVGTVRDASGAAVPGAEVTATDISTGNVRTTATNER